MEKTRRNFSSLPQKKISPRYGSTRDASINRRDACSTPRSPFCVQFFLTARAVSALASPRPESGFSNRFCFIKHPTLPSTAKTFGRPVLKSGSTGETFGKPLPKSGTTFQRFGKPFPKSEPTKKTFGKPLPKPGSTFQRFGRSLPKSGLTGETFRKPHATPPMALFVHFWPLPDHNHLDLLTNLIFSCDVGSVNAFSSRNGQREMKRGFFVGNEQP
jgi:hypothetical protein